MRQMCKCATKCELIMFNLLCLIVFTLCIMYFSCIIGAMYLDATLFNTCIIFMFEEKYLHHLYSHFFAYIIHVISNLNSHKLLVSVIWPRPWSKVSQMSYNIICTITSCAKSTSAHQQSWTPMEA